MSTLFDLWNSEPVERISNPKVQFDWKTETLRFRLGSDMTQLKLLVRHYIDGIGYVACNQKPVRRAGGGFDLTGMCKFCSDKKAFKQHVEGIALKEGRKLTKEESDKIQKFNKRYINLIGKAEVEVRCKGEIVKPLEDKAIVFKASDMFFDHLNQNFKTLNSIYENKGTLKKHWFTMNGQGTIMIDDICSAEEMAKSVEIDLTYFDKQTKAYDAGLKLVSEKESASEEAVAYDENDYDEPNGPNSGDDVIF